MSMPPRDYMEVHQGLEDGVGLQGSAVPPCAVVWTPIAPITCCLPCVGHMGITDSRGRLHDWHGCAITPAHPKHMLFGEPARYVVMCRPGDVDAARRWDDAIDKADAEYAHHMHVIACGHDCHSHVCRALNLMKYAGFAYHNKIEMGAVVFFCGRYVSVGAFLKTWAPFLIVLSIYLLVKFA